MPLNKEQIEAVNHIDGPCLVVSVPGSGKTTMLVERTAHLIETGIDSRNILCLTFTNKAAKEMKERIENKIGKDNVKSFIGTFHGLCLRIVKAFADKVGYSPNLNIITDTEQKEMMEKILRQMGYDKKEVTIDFESVVSQINKRRENLETLEDVINSFTDVLESKIVKEYFKQIKEYNLIDFSGILYETYLLLKNDSEVLAGIQDRFKYIQVDEVQDTNFAQFEIINLFGGTTANIMLIGDISQSIYMFRGARYQNVLDFLEKHKNCKKITLGKNYRSTPQIIGKADKLIKHNSSHMADKFETDNPDGEEPICKGFQNSKLESEYIADRIMYFVNDLGWEYKDIAVLYRLNKLSLEMQMSLSNRQIPFCVIGGQNFFDRKEIKDILAMLRFASNKKDVLSFHRVAKLFKGLGDVGIGMIENKSREENKSILEICKNIKNYTKRDSLIKAAEKMNDVFDVDFSGEKPSDALSYLVKKMDYFNHLMLTEKNAGEAKERTEHIVELIANASEDSKKNETIDSYLQNISLISSADSENEENSVVLMTMHACKGLEFPIVFMIGVEGKILPHEWPLAEAKVKGQQALDEAIEEERRIAFVGMTRSKKHLTMTYNRTRAVRDRYGNLVFANSGGPSRFLSEAGFKLNNY